MTYSNLVQILLMWEESLQDQGSKSISEKKEWNSN